MTAPLPDPLRGLSAERARRGVGAERAPRSPVRSATGVLTLVIVGVLGLLLTIGGIASAGFGGLLLGVGLTLVVAGAGALLVGRSWWVLLPSRGRGAGLLAVGVGLAVAGGLLAPPASTSPPVIAAPAPAAATSSSASPTSTPATSPTTPSSTRSPASTTVPAPVSAADSAATAVPVADPAERLIPAAAAGSALSALGTLTVKGRAPKTGYDRDLFGSGWVDVDRNGCDTRNDILDRDLTAVQAKPGTRGCVALSGTLQDPYTGRTISFTRGQRTSSAVQIDHVVALSDAWQKGAQGFDSSRRAQFANDPLNLLAVDGPANEAKGDGDAATWLPPNKAFRCAYVARQVTVKAKYGLWVTDAERAAVARVLSACPAEPTASTAAASAAAGSSGAGQSTGEPIAPAPAPTPTPTPAPAPAPARAPTRQPVAPAPASAYYQNCTAVRAAGVAPILRGQPGYRSGLDRDHDGIACEK